MRSYGQRTSICALCADFVALCAATRRVRCDRLAYLCRHTMYTDIHVVRCVRHARCAYCPSLLAPHPLSRTCPPSYFPTCAQPVFMMLGHAAGVAAVMASASGLAVHDISVPELQRTLRRQGAAISGGHGGGWRRKFGLRRRKAPPTGIARATIRAAAQNASIVQT